MIWKRYFFYEAIKSLLFFLLCLYFIFVIVDFSTHSVHFYSYYKPQLGEIILYYLHHFIGYLDIFLPLTLLLTTIKVLLGMNQKNELCALQTAGVSAKQLLFPFFILATLLTFVSYLNYEFCIPKSLSYIEEFQVAHSKNPEKKRKRCIQAYSLDDQSQLVFQNYDAKKKILHDVFWIKSPNEIYHCKSLTLTPPITGSYVDHLIRNDLFEKKASYPTLTFSNLKKIAISTKKNTLPFENRSLSSLCKQSVQQRFTSQEERANVLTHLNYKLAVPLLPLLVIFALAPFCLRFSRNTPTFFLYAISLFSLITFFTLIDAAVILSENQLLSPALLIWTPIASAFAISGYKFYKL